nr:MAG TPA: hypothetical protein [Caudoviricetes sp.]
MFLHVFVTFLLFFALFCMFMRCDCVLPLWHALHHAWCMVLVCMSCITSSSCVHHHVHHVHH